ncbi:MAG TPA: acetolactate synthase, partial [Actinomycetota bacterium]|nr:acetolactate synthase [Actinomycetota bacterium]
IYDGLHTRGMRLIDVRHEQAAAFAAEAHGKLTRTPGIAALTAGPGVINGMNAVVSAHFNGSPMVMLGGRAPQVRWGQGSLQEMDHVPLFRSVTKTAETVFETGAMAARTSVALSAAAERHRGPAFLDFPMDALFMRAETDVPAPSRNGDIPVEGDVEAAVRLLTDAERPVILLGSDVWADGAEKAARQLVETLQLPAFMNGMGRGVMPADHPLAFSAARGHAFARADVVFVVGTALDFRIGFGSFGEAKVVHVTDHTSVVGHHASPAAWIAGPLPSALEALSHATARDLSAWGAELRGVEKDKRAGFEGDLHSDAVPIHPARIYGELVPRLARDAIVIADGGDFASYAGKFIDVYEPGGWLDPGPYGCLGISAGYALAAGLLYPERQVVVMLGDGAAGFSLADWDTLVRFGVNVTLVCGNNGIWGLEKHPMKFLYGYDVAAELRPETRYDEIMVALGGHGEMVNDPTLLGEAIARAFSTPGPSLLNIVTDPEIAYPRSALLA